MAIINTQIKPFKAEAYHNGKFRHRHRRDGEGKWSIFFFYPADFTFVCPTETGDVADLYRNSEARRGGVLGLHRHPLHPQGLARRVGDDQEDQLPDDRDPTHAIAKNFDVRSPTPAWL